MGTEFFSVLGADGSVGGALARYLAERGAKVTAYGRKDAILTSRPLGHAIYCIGLTADYLDRPFDSVEAHVSLFARLLRDGQFDSMTYLSSTRLYDGTDSGREDAPLSLDPHNPRHLYDFSKGLGENLCRTAGRDNVRAARLACVYAPDLAAENFLHGTLKTAMEVPRLRIESSPSAARDYVHIDDVCGALAAIARRGRQQIYNVASGENVSNRRLFELISAVTGCDVTATGTPNAAVAPAVDITALREHLGIVPRRLDEALPGIVGAHRDGKIRTRAAS